MTHLDTAAAPTAIRFCADAAAVSRAVAVARLVKPAVGLLFSIQGDHCTVKSTDGASIAHATFPVTTTSGDGHFVFPAAHAAEFTFLEGELTATATSSNGAFQVAYEFGVGSVRHTSVDPRSVQVPTHPESDSVETMDAKLVAAALASVKPFVAAPDDRLIDDRFKSVRLFPDGTFYACDGRLVCYAESPAFTTCNLSVPARTVPTLERFLQRSSQVDVLETDRFHWCINEVGDALGWPRRSDELSSCPRLRKDDDIVAVVDTGAMRTALEHMREILAGDRPHARVHLDQARGIWFSKATAITTATGSPIVATYSQFRPTEPVVSRVNVVDLGRLFTMRAPTVEFRVCIVPPGGNRKESFLNFRTVEGTAEPGGVDAAGTVRPASFRTVRYSPGIER